MINRIEVQGTVGNCKLTAFEDRTSANFSVVTNYVYKNREGNGIVETMWFNVSAWEGKVASAETLRRIERGATVHVLGRLREREFTGSDGNPRKVTEIVPSFVEVVDQFEKSVPAGV